MTALPRGFLEASLYALPPRERAAFVSALEEAPVRGLRLRPGASVMPMRALVPGIGQAVPWAEEAYFLSGGSPAGGHALHAAGAYYIQEPSAMASATVLNARPGERVLDLCAAPGGKATQLAAAMGDAGVLVSNELVPGRAKVLSHNIERMGVMRAIVTCMPPEALAAKWPGWFDRILVDAPCSGEGMFRRDAKSRSQWTPQGPSGCAARQLGVLDAAAAMLRPGGALVYSTCTFNTLENEGVIERFLAAHPDFRPEPFSLAGVGDAPGGMLRLWPHRVHGEGHFVALLQKAGAWERPGPAQEAFVALEDLLPEAGICASLWGALLETEDARWIVPADMPPLSGVRVLRSGLCVARRKGKSWTPDHALAMAFSPERFAQRHALSPADAERYLAGEALPAPEGPPGWTVMAVEGFSLGWAKCVGGVYKNHLPKGLRRR